MKNLSRRHFIRQSLTAAGVLCVSPLAALSSSIPTGTTASTLSLNELEANARTAYNKHQFTESLTLYRQLIERNLSLVAYYDGATRALRQLGDMHAIVDTYKDGIRMNPDKVEFYARLAKFYREVYEGNRSLVRRMSSVESEELLPAAINFLKRAISITPQTYLYYELIECMQTRYRFAHSRRGAPRMRREQVRELLLADNSSEGVLIRPYIEGWYGQHVPIIAQQHASPASPTGRKIEEAKKKKKRRTLYHDKEKRQRERGLYCHHVECEHRALEECVRTTSRSNSESIDRICSFIHAHPQQSNVLGVTRSKLRLPSSEVQLLQLNDSWATANPTSWSLIALAAIQVRHRQADAAEMSLSKINHKLPQMHKATAAYYGVKAQTALVRADYSMARSYILEAFQERELKGGSSLALLYLYARSYAMEGKGTESLELLRVRLDGERKAVVADPILPYISPLYAEIPSFFTISHKALTKEEQLSLWCEIEKNSRMTNNIAEATIAAQKADSLRSSLRAKLKKA